MCFIGSIIIMLLLLFFLFHIMLSNHTLKHYNIYVINFTNGFLLFLDENVVFGVLYSLEI